jgi:hypothetical protein
MKYIKTFEKIKSKYKKGDYLLMIVERYILMDMMNLVLLLMY